VKTDGTPWWHDECELEYRYTDKDTGVKGYWCQAHNQWAYVGPIGKTWHYEEHPDYRVDRKS